MKPESDKKDVRVVLGGEDLTSTPGYEELTVSIKTNISPNEILEKLRLEFSDLKIRLDDPNMEPLPVSKTKSSTNACELADEWLRKNMEKRVFQKSDSGGRKLGGEKGYFNGGPGLAVMVVYNFFRRDPEYINFSSRYPHYPRDYKSLERCLELLDAVPEWRQRIEELKIISNEWSNMVLKWEDLEEAVRQQDELTVAMLIQSCELSS